jgi:hypothetical protein
METNDLNTSVNTTDRKFGRLYSPDMRDFGFMMRAPLLAPVIERYWDLGPILDQGATPTCVGHAWRQFLEAAPVPGTAGRSVPSPYLIYDESQKIDGFPGPPPPYEGTTVRAGAKVLQSMGLIYEYRWAPNIETLRDYVLTRGPVVVGTAWFSGMTDPHKIDGRFFLDPRGTYQGGHAYTIYAYNRRLHAFGVVNSWGTGWADRGRAYVDFDTMDTLLFRMNGEAVSALEVESGTTPQRQSICQRVGNWFRA